MAANIRFETSSASPDGAQFIGGIANGHRSMDRLASFRENHDARGSCSEQVPLTQLLSLDIPLGEQKYARPVELRRVMDDPAQVRSLENLGPEELKRVKHSISENSSRTREIQRHMSEAIVKLDKFRSTVQSKKRSKPDTTGVRGPGQSPPDRVLTKAAGQPDTVKPPEKGKMVPSKRLRTSITGGTQDVTRPNPTVKKTADRDSPRSSSVLPSTTEDKVRPPGEWEKSKLKGRRSVIKTDQNITSSGNGVLEGEREHKWSGQHRLSQEARPRSNETHGLRSGPVHGVTSIHKAEASLPVNGAVAQRNISKGDELTGCDKGDRFPGIDKERLPKNGLKPPLQEETITGSSTVTKGKASRTARPAVQFRVSTLTDKPQTTKAQLPTGQANRKRPAASRSSSPVAQWGGQRPQKMARGGRRIPPGGTLPSSDDNSLHDALPDRDPSATAGVRFTNSSNGLSGIPRRLPTGNLHFSAQSKSRTDRTVVVSESEESEEASESKVKDKGKKQGEWEPRPVSTHKTNLSLPVKASQSGSKEDGGDGVRRQGRSGRNFCPKPVMPAHDKLDGSTSNAKQLRSARTEKPDRPGRTPSKKATADRKSLSRMRRPAVGADIGLLASPGESDDDHEDLIAAVKAVNDASAAACKPDFWKEVEPYFAFLTDNDLFYLRQLAESSVTAGPNNDALQKDSQLANGIVEPDLLPDRSDVRSGVRSGGGGGWYDRIYPLSQRLLAALINEDDEEDGCLTGTTSLQDQKFMADGSLFQNGHGSYSPALDEAIDADDILVESRSDAGRGQMTKADGQCTSRSMSPLDSQYQSMTFDERIALELQSIGILVEDVQPDLSRDEDEVCTEISKLQDELKEQVAINRHRVAALEKSVMTKREEEIRERERLAVSKLVDMAYSRKKGCRGMPKSSSKAARAAYLAFSKRVLARVRKFEDGHSCFTDPGLRDILLCKSTKSNESIAAANSADTSVTPGVSESSMPKSGKLVLRRSEGNLEHPRAKDPNSSWKDRDEEVTGATSGRNSVSFSGAKGKRSERERDGKGQGKESHRKNESERLHRQAVGNVKGERKTKTKPRVKAAPLFKDVNGLGKPAEVPKETAVVLPPTLPLDDEAVIDLGPLGDDLGTWLDSVVPADIQGGELTSGLDIPMDDLSDLGMMV